LIPTTEPVGGSPPFTACPAGSWAVNIFKMPTANYHCQLPLYQPLVPSPKPQVPNSAHLAHQAKDKPPLLAYILMP